MYKTRNTCTEKKYSIICWKKSHGGKKSLNGVPNDSRKCKTKVNGVAILLKHFISYHPLQLSKTNSTLS